MPLSNEERENVVAYLDGELDDHEAQALEARLSRDPEARAEVDALRQTWGLLDYLPRAQPSETFTNRTMERLTLARSGARTMRMPSKPRLTRAGWFGWAAAIVVALGAGFGGGGFLSKKTGPPPDIDETLVRHLRVLERWRAYENIEDLDFLHSLDQPDLFGDDS